MKTKRDPKDPFWRCVRCYHGGTTIKCRLGLWAVYGIERSVNAEREARRYWAQYYEDGEYDLLLAGIRLADRSGCA